MIEDKSDYQLEKSRLEEFILKIFGVKLCLINELDIKPDNIVLNESTKLKFEDLDGNPLQLKYIVNLNENTTDSKNVVNLPNYKSVFNTNSIKIKSIEDYNTYYKHILKLCHTESTIEANYGLLIDKAFGFRGFFKDKSNPDKISIVKISRSKKCVLKNEQKFKITELVTEPRYKHGCDHVEATYIFNQGCYSAKWWNCFNVFDKPDSTAECKVHIKIDPENESSSLYHLKEELEQLKILHNAYLNDESSWTIYAGEKFRIRPEQFNAKLDELLKNKGHELRSSTSINPSALLLSVVDGNISSTRDFDMTNTYNFNTSATISQIASTRESLLLWNANVCHRETDTSEDLWTLLRYVSSKSDYRRCVEDCMKTLKQNHSKVKLNSDNETQFNKLLIQRYRNSDEFINFMTNFDFIIEVGIFKLTNDFLFILGSELPEMSQKHISQIFEYCCRSGHMTKLIERLQQFFILICHLEILKSVLNVQEYKVKALDCVEQLLNGLMTNSPYSLSQSFTTKMMHISTKLNALSALWIAHFHSKSPMITHKAVVFELEKSNDVIDIYRHDMELLEVSLPFVGYTPSQNEIEGS